MQAKDRIFVSIDVSTIQEAEALLDQMVGVVGNVKIGLQLATSIGWKACIDLAHSKGFKIFCDAKFKDIPNTVEEAVYALSIQGPDYFTVMADNSFEALQAIRRGADRAAQELGIKAPKIIGVTVLTSIDLEECMAIYGGEPAAKVMQFAENAVLAGLDAIVCSPEEVSVLRANSKFDGTLLITPGVRPDWAQSNDQKRSATPSDTIVRGADMLVIGRPIAAPPASISGPKEAVEKIIEELEGVK